jgi:serine protease Do
LLLALLAGAPGRALGQAPRQPLENLAIQFGADGPEIGVTIRDVTAEDAAPAKGGAMIESVRADSPAAQAGMRAGDLVTVFDGEPVRSARQLARLIDESPRNKQVAVSVIRSGNTVTLSVTPEARAPWQAAWPSPFPQNVPERELFLRQRPQRVTPGLFVAPATGRLGIQVQDLTTQLGEYFGVSSGVLVASVADNTPAKTAGLQAGDVITRVNGETVGDGAQLRQRTVNATGATTLTVMRDRQEQTLTLDLPARAAPVPPAPRRYSR